MHGYKIPCLTNTNLCTGISGTSIAAPLFAGIAALKLQQAHDQQVTLNPGSFRCLLHNQTSTSFCVVPSSLFLPSIQYPSFLQPL